MPKTKAVWIECPMWKNNRAEHNMLDNCYWCAPYWWHVAICPIHQNRKLMTKKGSAESGWCQECKKHYDISEESKD